MIGGARLESIKTINGAVCGALFSTDDGYIQLSCPKIILATGGNADIYGRSVFPVNQHGATGVALRAGAKANNLCYWQYGLASVKVRWNVSGSYQQAIPEYIDDSGKPIAPDMKNRNDMIFLKGYQWPFDAGRAEKSAAVDRAVKAVCDAGGRAFMDFTRDENHSILISSHIVSDLEKLCDYVAFLHKGKLLLCEEKDLLLAEYGLIHCTAEELKQLPPEAIRCQKHNPYGVEALVHRSAVPAAVAVSPVSMEELFVFMAKEAR